MTKKGHKRKLNDSETKPEPTALPPVRHSDEPLEKKTKWTNKQRVLVFSSRGINHRDRHLMEDLKKLMPHHKPEAKMERSKTLSVINEMCEMKNCTKAMMFEGRKKKDLYMWLSNIPNGPSVKFLIENVNTMAELKLTGNCLRGARPILSFDPGFMEKPHYTLLKEIFTQIFSVPKHHPKSQPFFDHVYTFTILDNRVWFRNFQILSEDGALAEVGPRFVLNPVKIFSGSFGGVPLWENPNYVSPAKYRQQIRLGYKNKYINRVQQKAHAEATRPKDSYSNLTPLEDIFHGDPLEKARDLEDEVKNKENLENVTVVERPQKKKKKSKKNNMGATTLVKKSPKGAKIELKTKKTRSGPIKTKKKNAKQAKKSIKKKSKS